MYGKSNNKEREGGVNCVYFEKFLEGDPEKSVKTEGESVKTEIQTR